MLTSCPAVALQRATQTTADEEACSESGSTLRADCTAVLLPRGSASAPRPVPLAYVRKQGACRARRIAAVVAPRLASLQCSQQLGWHVWWYQGGKGEGHCCERQEALRLQMLSHLPRGNTTF